MDLKLRGGPRLAGVASEEEPEGLVDIRCVQAKSVFEAFYKRGLRLSKVSPACKAQYTKPSPHMVWLGHAA